MRFKRGPFLRFYLALARAGLHIEYLWPALWPATALAGLFVAAALLDVFIHLPVWLHGLLVLGFLLAFVAALYRAVTRMPRIGASAARHRIEVSSELAHRPLAALNDTLAIGADDPTAAGLWQAHLRRMASQSETLRLKLPRAGLSGRDFWGLRAGVAALLLIGVIAAGGDSFTRLGRSLIPPLNAVTAAAGLELNIWITPPPYTGAAPVVLHVGGKDGRSMRASETETVEVPAGSALMAQLAGGGKVPDLVVGASATPFNRIDTDSYHIETELTGGDRLAVAQKGREIGAWPLAVIPDRAPTVEFSAAPESNQQLRLVLPYAAADDYGLKNVTASVRRLDGAAVPDGDDEILLRLPLPGGDKTQVNAKSNHDLVSHVWAGLPVLVHLIANDERELVGVSTVEPVVLPERRFTHPVAKELYEIRKQLTVRSRDRRLAVLKIDGVADEPERFNEDSATYLALRVARERLRQDNRNRAVADVQRMLWDAALKLEEGIAANANRDLMAAQRALQEALERGASQEEIDRLMSELREALDKFMSALMQELQQRGELMEMDPDGQITDMQDLQRMLEQAQELMRQGSREAAEQLMAELQRMIDSLRGALSRRGGEQQRQMSEAQRQAQQSMRELQDLIRRQEKLLDETYKQHQQQQSRRGPQGRQGDQRGDQQGEQGEGQQDLAELQKELRRRLGELMEKFGEMLGDVPEGLGQAEGAMRESEQALGSGQPGEAIDPENRALDSLREGMQQGGQAMARQMGRGNGFQFGFNQGGRFGPFDGPRLEGLRPGNRDPFGRQLDDGDRGTATGSVKIPDQSEMARAREILDELRRRLGDLWRPEMEVEYLKRLLRRF